MEIIYNKKDQVAGQPTKEKETRFSRLVVRLDSKDRTLDPGKRKRKWMYILGALFFLYLASFLIPTPELSHRSLDPKEATGATNTDSAQNSPKQKSMTFEMPVDSFETLLKNRINEKLPEKK
jgi:hypothetical protein